MIPAGRAREGRRHGERHGAHVDQFLIQTREADVVMLTLPDELAADVYASEVAPSLEPVAKGEKGS